MVTFSRDIPQGPSPGRASGRPAARATPGAPQSIDVRTLQDLQGLAGNMAVGEVIRAARAPGSTTRGPGAPGSGLAVLHGFGPPRAAVSVQRASAQDDGGDLPAWENDEDVGGGGGQAVEVDAGDAPAPELAGAIGPDIGPDIGSVVDDVAAGATDAASGAWDAVTGTLDDLRSAAATGAEAVWNETSDTASRVIDGVGEAASGGWDQLTDTARDLAGTASGTAGDAWAAVAGASETVATRVEDAATSAWETAAGTAAGAWEAVSDTARDVASSAEEAAGEAWDAVTAAGGRAWDAVEGTMSSVWDVVTEGASRGLELLAKNVSVPGSQVQSRGLTGGEITAARQIFGDALDYRPVVVTRGSIASLGSARTTGNVVDMTDDLFVAESLNLTDEGTSVLVHELAHVFQFQHNGLAYIPDSLWEQLISKIRTGSQNGAYNWRVPDAAKIPWEEWHAEQQAQAVQDYNDLLTFVGPLSDAQEATMARLSKYAIKMCAGPKAKPALESSGVKLRP